MSREKAKKILYKHEEKNNGAINHWQAKWILDAMEEYAKEVKANSVLGDVSNSFYCKDESINSADRCKSLCYYCKKFEQ